MPFPDANDYRYMADYIPTRNEEPAVPSSKNSVEPTEAPERSASNGYSNPDIYKLQKTTFNDVNDEILNDDVLSDFLSQADVQERQLIDELDTLAQDQNERRESVPGVTQRDNSSSNSRVSPEKPKSNVSDISGPAANSDRSNMLEDSFRSVAKTTRSKLKSVKNASVKFLGSLRKSERTKVPNTLFPRDKWELDGDK